MLENTSSALRIKHFIKSHFSLSHGEIMGSIPVWVMLRTTRSLALKC